MPLVDAAGGRPAKKQKTAKARAYIPAQRSGGYAILLVLHRQLDQEGYRGYMTKRELIYIAQTLCDSSFTTPEAGSRYTAWSTMSTLIKKELVVKTNSPARYALTDLGTELAERLEAAERDPSLLADDADSAGEAGPADGYGGYGGYGGGYEGGDQDEFGDTVGPARGGKKKKAAAAPGDAPRTCGKCGSTTHLTARSKHCPFNPKNQAAAADDGDGDGDSDDDVGVGGGGGNTAAGSGAASGAASDDWRRAPPARAPSEPAPRASAPPASFPAAATARAGP